MTTSEIDREDELRSASCRVAGSFRDPSGFVFLRGEHVFRALDEEAYALLKELDEKGIFRSQQDTKRIVRTDFVEQPALLDALSRENRGYRHFLEHERLTAISYPYEWSVSMLADAGLLTLDLQLALLDHGYALKDATAYNILFSAGSPLFIDILSIEQPKRFDLWFALGQYMRMFLFPLLLVRYCGRDLRSYFLAELDGRNVEQVAGSFHGVQRLRPAVFSDVILPLWLHRWAERRTGSVSTDAGRFSQNSDAQRINLRRLHRKTERLAAGYRMPRNGQDWLSYKNICNYSSTSEERKKTLIREFLEETRPQRVLDLGCNTGDYSHIAAKCGAEVIAVDADHDVVEDLYRRVRGKGVSITPMVADIANPSPGIGFMNAERTPFFERVNGDCVLALALMHHLLVSANLSMVAIRDMMYRLTKRDLVIEFVPTDDSMFQRLLRFRVNLFDSVTLDLCERIFSERFDIMKQVPIPDSGRSLLFCRKRE